MATISKFYLLDAATANTGTMPGAGDAFAQANPAPLGGSLDASGDATDARTARDATDTPGASQQSATWTQSATIQQVGYRRFVSAPLAARTFQTSDGVWTFSYARAESNLNHNQSVQCVVSAWRPSTGSRLGGGVTGNQQLTFVGSEPTSAGAEQAESVTASWGSAALTISDGDILVFEVGDAFTAGMSSAYTSTFYYNGTTEGSSTSCATFVTPPAPLTLFTGAAAEVIPDLVVAPLR